MAGHRFHETVFGIYFDDLDPFEILHNARYLLLFERAVGGFWLENGWGAFQEDRRQFHLVRHNEIEYLSPVQGVGKVRVRVWVEKLGTTSLTFGFRMMPMDQDTDHARGRRTIVHVDRERLKPTPWSDEFRERIAPYLQEQD